MTILDLSYLPGAGSMASFARLIELLEMRILMTAAATRGRLSKTMHSSQIRSPMTLTTTERLMASLEGKSRLLVTKTR